MGSPLRKELGAEYGIRGVPSLVIIDDQGNLITKDGRSALSGPSSGARQVLREWQCPADKE